MDPINSFPAQSVFLLEIGAVSEIEPISQASKSYEVSDAMIFYLLCWDGCKLELRLQICTGENQLYYLYPFNDSAFGLYFLINTKDPFHKLNRVKQKARRICAYYCKLRVLNAMRYIITKAIQIQNC